MGVCLELTDCEESEGSFASLSVLLGRLVLDSIDVQSKIAIAVIFGRHNLGKSRREQNKPL